MPDRVIVCLSLSAPGRSPLGAYHFDVGWLSGLIGRSVEVDRAGTSTYSLEIDAPMYRGFRLPDVYSADPEPVAPPPALH